MTEGKTPSEGPADGIAAVAHNEATGPLFLVMNVDVAKSLGGILKGEINL